MSETGRQRNPFFRSFSLPLDPNDRVTHRHVAEKVIPWSKTPFDMSITDEQAEKFSMQTIVEEEDEDAPFEEAPQWLELLFDLSWTITFSGLTGGTPIKDGGAIASYTVFFILAWWLWVAQVSYDTKFYTNDWFHRIMLVFQFIAFGALASFTDGFDILFGITHDATTDPVDLQVEDEYNSRAFRAICLVFGITRFLLAIQYIRVSRLVKHSRAGNLFMTIASLIVSGLLFFITFFILTAFPQGFSGSIAHVAKFVLWGFALAIEIGVYMYSASPYGLLRQGSMSERLASLTTVVLGEGLNGLIEPLVSVAKSIGFNTASAAQILCMALLVFMVFVLYFASFDTRGAITPLRQKCIVFMHFPTHLLLILLLEGMKSVMGFLTLSQSLTAFLLVAFNTNNDVNDFKREYAKLGLDFVAIAQSISTIPATDQEKADPNLLDNSRGFRLIAAAVQAILDQFKVLTDDLKDQFHNYVFDTKPNLAAEDAVSAVYTTGDGDPPHLDELLNSIQSSQLSPVSWIAAIAGAFLFCLLLLMLFRGAKSNRFFAWSIVTRFIIAAVLTLLVLLDLRPAKLVNFIESGAFLPTVLGIYIVQYAVDYIIHWFMARQLKKVPPPLPQKKFKEYV
ncbi:hypothetical protein EXIGLDRAFT_734624 [Exidia glandulosa HHB12029]|uniref:Low temperature requirement A n=1 Tax=Exidia glandulosa HHB12029 TaxID=1314781 RepID=A0A165PQ92_EXIGL|nr:hypothetical protein EXIGLDRAFT_734624 [Exidia glandulosa HHB12029]